jgi:hypothetical protein
MNVIQENPQTLAESGCRGGRPSAQVSTHANLVIENLNEFAAAGAAGSCFCVSDLVIHEPRPAAA